LNSPSDFPSRALLIRATLLTVVLVPLAWRYLDHALASAINDLLSDVLGPPIEAHYVLGIVVLVLTVSGIVARLLPTGPAWFAELRAAAILAGVVAPVSFIVKTLLKLVFGRVETRVWLMGNVPDGLHWFAGGQGLNGFPSGHMTICLALAAVGWRCYPGLRWLWVSCSVMLPFLLVGTDYHFISDVIAGAWLALVLYAVLTSPRALAIFRIPSAAGGGRSEG
jgi:membrane-associated phospholipid phosphatase